MQLCNYAQVISELRRWEWCMHFFYKHPFSMAFSQMKQRKPTMEELSSHRLIDLAIDSSTWGSVLQLGFGCVDDRPIWSPWKRVSKVTNWETKGSTFLGECDLQSMGKYVCWFFFEHEIHVKLGDFWNFSGKCRKMMQVICQGNTSYSIKLRCKDATCCHGDECYGTGDVVKRERGDGPVDLVAATPPKK